MCKANEEMKQYVEKSHAALASVISNLGAETNERLSKVEKTQKYNGKILKEVQKYLHTIAERL